MEEQLITFETAKLAKEKGFNISGNNIYENEELLCEVEFKNWNNGTLCLLAPTQSLLQRWLREVRDIYININTDNNKSFYSDVNEEYFYDGYRGKALIFKSYEEALEDGLQEALRLIK